MESGSRSGRIPLIDQRLSCNKRDETEPNKSCLLLQMEDIFCVETETFFTLHFKENRRVCPNYGDGDAVHWCIPFHSVAIYDCDCLAKAIDQNIAIAL